MEKWNLPVAYVLVAAGCVTAGLYGLMSGPAPAAYTHAIAYAFGIAIACHSATWFQHKQVSPDGGRFSSG